MTKYTLKDKIEVNNEFIADLITKSWHESEMLQHQAANIDTSTKLGTEVARLLKNMSTNYYVMLGCLESLSDGELEFNEAPVAQDTADITDDDITAGLSIASNIITDNDISEPDANQVHNFDMPVNQEQNFEPFEYFVDFDEPLGEPLSDEDLYGKK
jgi:hypothetical protein